MHVRVTTTSLLQIAVRTRLTMVWQLKSKWLADAALLCWCKHHRLLSCLVKQKLSFCGLRDCPRRLAKCHALLDTYNQAC